MLVAAARVGHRRRCAASQAPNRSGASGGPTAATSRSTRYSPLDQINADNFNKLEVAWRFKTDNLGPRPEFNLQATPLMVDGVLYTTAGTRRAVVALDAATGEMLWMHSDERRQARRSRRRGSSRAAASRTGPTAATTRIVYVTPGYQLVALDAKTGVPVAGFGKNGIVDLKLDDDQPMDLDHRRDRPARGADRRRRTSIVVGAAHLPGGAPKSKTNEKGYVRGFDVRTGKRLWIFHTIPRPGEFGNDTWENDSWSYTGNAGVWAQMSVDEELGTGLPAGRAADRRLLRRPSAGQQPVRREPRRARSEDRQAQVALPARAPRHLGLGHPVRADPRRPHRRTAARSRPIAQPTKQGWVYVFDRATGQPVWPIEERPVEKGDVPGEWYSPTQPFVTKPPPFERPGRVDRRSDRLHAGAAGRSGEARVATTRSVRSSRRRSSASGRGPLATLMLPAATGGANWQGGAFDPETKMFYIFTNNAVTRARPGAAGSGPVGHVDYVQGTARDPDGAAGRRGARGGAGAARGVRAGARRGGGARRWRRRRRRRSDRAGPAAHQAAVRPHHRDRSEQGRARLADRARRDARQHQESSGAQGPDHPAHRPSGPHRRARHQDAGDRRRRRLLHDAERPARRDAARLRQGDRARKSARSTCRRRRPDRR